MYRSDFYYEKTLPSDLAVLTQSEMDSKPLAPYAHFPLEYHSGPFSAVENEGLDQHLITVLEQPFSLGKKLSAQHSESVAIKITNGFPKMKSIRLGKQSCTDGRKPKWPAAFLQNHPDHHHHNHQHQVQEMINKEEQKVPVRRSHKVADRITALQKIVSPYGKTDTASVLHEASVFIKFLVEQIEKLTFEENMIEKEDELLGSKGVCLVPVSLMQKLIKEQSYNQHSSLTPSIP